MMRTIAAAGIAAVLLSGCMTDEETALSTEGESRLAAELDGYVAAGPPVSCVRAQDMQGNRSVTGDAILFSGSGGRLWVNRTRGNCPSLEGGRSLRHTTTQSQLCSGDIVNVFDPATGVEYGGCSLGEFTPYRRR
jgi:hypothetical protein